MIIMAAAAALCTGLPSLAQVPAGPDATYKYAQRDSCELFLDIYEPDERLAGSGADAKPTIIFMFGGGFIGGERDTPHDRKWFNAMADRGYRVVSIDYRLGLKGAAKVGVAQVNLIDNAIHMAVDDLFSATGFLIDNAESLGIDPDNLVISGSSAGAISVLQAEYELCNRNPCAQVLPEDFRYAGVMSFSGAILSREGALDYAEKPSPVLLLHGTADKVVNYTQIRFFNLGFFGSSRIADRFSRLGFEYWILRFAGRGHEIAGFMYETIDSQIYFLENEVMTRSCRTVDATISDPTLPSGENASRSRKELYGGSE